MTIEFKPAQVATIFVLAWLAVVVIEGVAKYSNEVMFIIHQNLERACKK